MIISPCPFYGLSPFAIRGLLHAYTSTHVNKILQAARTVPELSCTYQVQIKV
jgi:hypothetical protein